jgi:2-O-methyltransferase
MARLGTAKPRRFAKENAVAITALWNKAKSRGVQGVARAAYKEGARVVRKLTKHSYLRQTTGLIHVGANLGQERELYAKYKLNVLWVEPLPDIFERLCQNIKSFPKQTAVKHLITDQDGGEYLFHIASNDGASSSLLEPARHKTLFPDVRFESTMTLKSITLDSLLQQLGGSNRSYQTLVLDTQGSELMVLKGAVRTLSHLKFVLTEAADFESYAGCAQVDELTAYLRSFGFKLIRSDKQIETPHGERYFDLLYRQL